jgi:hypothetical protein
MLLDNGSVDGSAQWVRAQGLGIEVLSFASNLGFAAANNRGIALAISRGADYVVLLNDDTVVLDGRWISYAVTQCEEDGKIGMVGFRLTRDEATPCPVTCTTRQVKRASGCALMIRASVFRDVGMLDEEYFAYCEESDLEARAIAALYRIVEVSIPVYHYGGGSFGRTSTRYARLFTRNVIRYAVKNRGILWGVLQAAVVFDLAVSPLPLIRNSAYAEWRERLSCGPRWLRFTIFARACLWNVWHLRRTLASRREAYERVRRARAYRSGINAQG